MKKSKPILIAGILALHITLAAALNFSKPGFIPIIEDSITELELEPEVIEKLKAKPKPKTKKKIKASNGQKIEKTAKRYLGKKYVFGGLDCSNFVKKVYKKHGKNLPRTANQQASSGKHIDKSKLQKGDLVFFKNTYKRGISHVGIYLGKGDFIHASSAAKKVTISKLNKTYYKNHYAGARRI